jgi:hypothetical protein
MDYTANRRLRKWMRPTAYNGTLFSTRTEARWACFWHLLCVPYLYQPEQFELEPDRIYLPEFYLPTLNLYVEIKGGQSPSVLDASKSIRFVSMTNNALCLFHGHPLAYGIKVLPDMTNEDCGTKRGNYRFDMDAQGQIYLREFRKRRAALHPDVQRAVDLAMAWDFVAGKPGLSHAEQSQRVLGQIHAERLYTSLAWWEAPDPDEEPLVFPV